MARRRSDIAGLAALAALGYGLYNSKKKEEEARKKPAAAETPSSEPTITSDMRRRAEEEGEKLSPGEIAAMSGPAIRPDGPAPSPVKTSTPRQKPEQVSLAKKYSVPDTGDETARLTRRYAAPTTRDALISQIPAGGTPTVTGGERVSESELDRNVANTMAAFGPGKLAGIGAIGMEMRGAAAARKAALAKSERSAKLAEELRSSQQPTSFSSTRSAVDRNPTKSTRYKEDESGVEFKRGGKASSKPAAKGWGKARGARQAKYY